MFMFVGAGYKVAERGADGWRMMGGYAGPQFSLFFLLWFITWIAIVAAIVAFARWMWKKGDKVR